MRQGENSLFYFLFLGIIPPSEPFVNRFSKNIFYVWQKLFPLVSTDARGLFYVVLAGVFGLPAIVFAQISSKTGRQKTFARLLPALTPRRRNPPSDARGFPGGTPGRLFFRHFFATRQRNGIKTSSNAHEVQCESPATHKKHPPLPPLRHSYATLPTTLSCATPMSR